VSLSYPELQQIVNELQTILPGSRLEKIYQTETYDLVMEWYRSSQQSILYFDSRRGWVRMHLIRRKPKAKQTSGNLCLYVRKHFANAILEQVTIENEDRIIALHLRKPEEQTSYKLIFEMMDRKANVYLVDPEGMVEYSLFRSSYKGQGKPYQYPSIQGSTKQHKPVTVPEDKLFNQVVEETFATKSENTSFELQKRSLIQLIQRAIKKEKRFQVNVEKDLQSSGDPDEYEKKGELLKSVFHQIHRGMKELTVSDYTQNPPKGIKISVDPDQTPAQNIESYFTKARKAKSARPILEEKLSETQSKLEQLDSFLKEQNQAQTLKKIKQLNEKFKAHPIVQQIIREWEKILKPKEESKPKKQQGDDTFRYFLSEAGVKIYVGRSNKENEKLTFQFAKGKDTWLHCRDYSGSHVVIQSPNRAGEIDPETIQDACQLAVFYSKAKNNGGGEVIITQRKHIGKAKGAPTGQVSISKHKILDISLDEQRIKLIKTRRA
jgi:predicted ribosome quality control (RQC) complex YloA/Tae2 family protein